MLLLINVKIAIKIYAFQEYGSQADGSPDSGVKWVYFGTREQLERSKPVHKLKRMLKIVSNLRLIIIIIW